MNPEFEFDPKHPDKTARDVARTADILATILRDAAPAIHITPETGGNFAAVLTAMAEAMAKVESITVTVRIDLKRAA